MVMSEPDGPYPKVTMVSGVPYPQLPQRDRDNLHVPSDHHLRMRDPLPLEAGCPVKCLSAVLSAHAYGSLIRADRADFDPPLSVADVVTLCREELLGQIYGLGPRKIDEIQACLTLAGLLPSQAAAVSTGRKESQ
jgi:hypothetical protein